MKTANVLRPPVVLLLAAIVLFVPILSAQNISKNYVILAKGQGPGSTNFAKSLGSALTANLEKIGVVLATSADPNFATWAAAQPGVQAVAEDPEIQWLPKEHIVQFTGNDLGVEGVNSEPFNGYLWNLRAIHADVTAASGDKGAG